MCSQLSYSKHAGVSISCCVENITKIEFITEIQFVLLVTELIHQLNAACELDFIIYVIMPVNFSYFFLGTTSRKITLSAEKLQKRNTRAV